MEISVDEGHIAEESYFFEPVVNKWWEEKDTKEILTKWGLSETMKVASFRFNQAFRDYEIDRFLRDLFNNPNVRYSLPNVQFQQQAVSSVQSERLRCGELTLQIFDKLEQQQIVRKEYYEQIQICDKLRECLLLEQSQSYCVFNESQRKELLMKIFQIIVVGGAFNQYEDMLQPYLDWTKKIYKNIVSVRKRPETGEIFIESQAFQVKTMDQGKTFKKGYHPQNMLIVVISPGIRTAHIIVNQWKKFW